ncbi:MAG: phosphoribosylglycinamide formyltransferase [Fervidobacterium sp.]|uniref:phosphoribosylglycinamide formyltransferase n=1 Tax=Fervidobacterium sp. TaxID=1871331 RepID=UPI00404A6E1D
MHGLFQSRLPRIVVLASGNGSNFQTIAEKSISGELGAQIECLIVDRECYALERASKLGIKSHILKKPWHEDFERLIDEIKPDLIVLAGFMRIIPENIVKKYFPKIVNIHPSLLPAFPGREGIRQAFDYGVKVTGITIHFVDSGIDTGPIIFQKAIEVDEKWTLGELEERIHAMEHEYYWQIVKKLLYETYKIEGRKVLWGV